MEQSDVTVAYRSCVANAPSSPRMEENNVTTTDDPLLALEVEEGNGLRFNGCSLCSESGVCEVCVNKNSITKNRRKARKYLEIQAKKMKMNSEIKFPPIPVGRSVTIPVPEVDRSKTDARNIIGVVMEVTSDGYYKVGCRNGIINTLYARNQIGMCKEDFVSLSDDPNASISLRKASSANSLSGGQGFFKCFCKRKCESKK